MFEESPNGHFINDLIVFNSLNAGGYVSKGFIFEPPDMINAQVSELNEFQDQLSLLMQSITENQRLQIQYYCDSDYRHELLRYNAETQKATNVWTRRSRNERFERYWRLMTERRLRRQRLVFYLSRKIETSSKGIKSAAALTEYYNQILGQFRSEFEHTHEMLTEIFAGQGARIIPMKDADHFRHCKTFLNPSLAERFDYDETTEKVIIQTGIRIFKGDLVCRSDYAVYDRGTDSLELSGLPTVNKKRDVYRAGRIRVNLKTEDVVLEGRVSGTITPDKKETKDDKKPQEPGS